MQVQNQLVFDLEFKKAYSKLLKMELPASTALKLVKTSKTIDEQSADVFNVRDSLLGRYCSKDDDGKVIIKDGQPVFKSEENQTNFFAEIDDLLSETFEIDLDDKIALPESASVTGEDIIALQSIIKID